MIQLYQSTMLQKWMICNNSKIPRVIVPQHCKEYFRQARTTYSNTTSAIKYDCHGIAIQDSHVEQY
eukprot:5839373-Ditylum_brightwellii.AAC.1